MKSQKKIVRNKNKELHKKESPTRGENHKVTNNTKVSAINLWLALLVSIFCWRREPIYKRREVH